MASRGLTDAEIALAKSVFGHAIAYRKVRLHERKFWPFHPKRVTMAPDGHLWFHPKDSAYCADFCDESIELRGHFIHEMTHVWQHQQGVFLPLARHPFCRYDYDYVPGKPFRKYGIEQQAEITRHLFFRLHQKTVPSMADKPDLATYQALVPFGPGKSFP